MDESEKKRKEVDSMYLGKILKGFLRMEGKNGERELRVILLNFKESFGEQGSPFNNFPWGGGAPRKGQKTRKNQTEYEGNY